LVVYVFPLFAVPAMSVGAVFAFKRNKPGAHEVGLIGYMNHNGYHQSVF
jgi:hypothetical protein